MKAKLFAIARAYMINLYNEMNGEEFDPIAFDKYETEHVEYDYHEDYTGAWIDGILNVYVDGEREFGCFGNIAR